LLCLLQAGYPRLVTSVQKGTAVLLPKKGVFCFYLDSEDKPEKPCKEITGINAVGNSGTWRAPCHASKFMLSDRTP